MCSTFEESQFDFYGTPSDCDFYAPSPILRHTASRVQRLIERNRKVCTCISFHDFHIFDNYNYFASVLPGQVAEEKNKSPVVNQSPDPNKISSMSRTEQNLNDLGSPLKLSLAELATPDSHEKKSISSNLPAPDTVQHFAETYIAATKIWCAAAVRLARHLNNPQTQTRSKKSSQTSSNDVSRRFLLSQERVLKEVRHLCQEFRVKMAKGGSNTTIPSGWDKKLPTPRNPRQVQGPKRKYCIHMNNIHQ